MIYISDKTSPEKSDNSKITNADMKILQYIRLHIKNSITQIAHYNTFHFLRCALYICKMFVYKYNNKIEHIKK